MKWKATKKSFQITNKRLITKPNSLGFSDNYTQKKSLALIKFKQMLMWELEINIYSDIYFLSLKVLNLTTEH